MRLSRPVLIAIVIFLIDRFSKWFVVEYLDLASRYSIKVVPPYLNFAMAWNTGINFGFLNGNSDLARYLLIAIALIIVAGVLYWSRNKSGWIIAISTGAVVGGALGNVFDRLTYGAVADFLNMSCCGIDNPYSFNIADVAIFAGAFGLIVFGDRKKS